MSSLTPSAPISFAQAPHDGWRRSSLPIQRCLSTASYRPIVLLLLLPAWIACAGPEPLAPSRSGSAARLIAAPGDPARPWAAVRLDRDLAFVPGAGRIEGVSPAVARAASLLGVVTNADRPLADRTEFLLDRLASVASFGRFGLPTDPPARRLFAEQTVRFLETAARDLDVLSAPWTYAELRGDAFVRLPPRFVDGYRVALRRPDLSDLLLNGATLVLLGKEAVRRDHIVLSVWTATGQLAALHIVPTARRIDPADSA